MVQILPHAKKRKLRVTKIIGTNNESKNQQVINAPKHE